MQLHASKLGIAFGIVYAVLFFCGACLPPCSAGVARWRR